MARATPDDGHRPDTRSGLNMASRSLSLALVTETYPPEVNGVAMTLGRLVGGLEARGHRIRIVRPRQKDEKVGQETHNQLLTQGLPIPRYPELRFGLPAAGRLRKSWLTQPPDILHIATEGPLGYSALSLARNLSIPVVSTFHTNFHSYSRHYGIGWLHGRIESYLRWFHNRTAATLVPTRALSDALTQQGFRNVGVLSRGVDTRLFHPGRRCATLRSYWGAQENDPVAIVVGRLAPEKNLGLALKAFSDLRSIHPRTRMVFVGDGPLRKPLERRHPDCHFAGNRHGEDLATHYASADLFLFPSLTETFGNVVTEALASGLPVVAYDCAAAADLIVNGQNGFLAPPGNAASFIAAAVQVMETNSPWRQTCPASVRHLDWERIYNTYEALLDELIAGKSLSPTPDGSFGFVAD
jgi:glycosyltransferase involved in cell wall biosynthesis